MKSRTVLSIFVLMIATLACNLPGGAPQLEVVATNTTQPLFTETPTQASLPTETPLPTLTPTPTVPIAWPSDKGVNCRYGPSTDWVSVGSLLVGQTAEIQGRNDDSSWWYVTNPDSGHCWVAASVTLTAGNLANLLIISPPQAQVTSVKIKLDPKSISLPGCFGPVQPMKFEGTISVNGPVKVKWHFETQQDGPMSDDTLNFKFADSKNVEASSFTPDASAGTFWVHLVIVEPNSKTAEANYKVECP